MSVVLDTSVVVAAHDTGDTHHERARRFVEASDVELVTTPLAVAEMDHLVLRGGGPPSQHALWRDLDAGAMTVRWWADGMRDTLAIARVHPWLGLADASLVALMRIARTTSIATFDHHFRSVTTPDGQALTVLPE